MTAKETLDLIHNDEYIISNKKKQKINRPFDSFGTNPNDKKELTSIYDVFEQFNPTDLKLFCMLARVRDYNTNECVLRRKDLNDQEKNAIDRRYKHLKALNVIIRVRDETYLFNPDYLIPNTKHIEQITKRYKKETGSSEAISIDDFLKQSEES